MSKERPRAAVAVHRMSIRSLTPAVLVLASASMVAQTRVTAPDNKFTPAEDVKLGREAAAQVREQLPVMRDTTVDDYIERVGARLVRVIRQDLRHAEFSYSFDPIDAREINAFALPGGPMFVNRGMLEAARSEGEVAGVMAHEISHVILRHGTAQASKASRYQMGELAGTVFGAIIGGRVGSAIAQGTQFSLGAAFLRFGREYERQADIEGAQMMARAGYDPREMASMFRTIEKQGGSSGPEWLSSHPNPGNRSEYITREAAALRIENPVVSTDGFEKVQAHLRSMPPPSREQATRRTRRN